MYAIGRQPLFVGTTSPDVTVYFILSGSHIIGGAKQIGAVVANAAGGFSFRMPAGIKNGTYTLEARVLNASGSAYELSQPLAFKVGPAPHIRTPKPKPKPTPKPKSTKPVKGHTVTKKVVHAQPRVVHAAAVVKPSSSTGHPVDQAVHALMLEDRLFKKKVR